MALQFCHNGLAADYDAGLWSTEQFVAGKTHHVRAGAQAFLNGRLVPEAEGVGFEQCSGADVVCHRQAVLAAERDQLRQIRLGGEADDPKVAVMGAQNERHAVLLRGDGLFIIVQVGAVGGAYFDQLPARLLQNIWHAKAAADLHQLSA